jgi:hypothetical protein
MMSGCVVHGNVKAFCNKLRLLESQIRAKNSHYFPTLATQQFDTRFADFQNKYSTFAIFSRPMDADVNNEPENFQMEVIELQANLVLKSQFNNIALTEFYKFYLVEERYTNLRAFSRKIVCLFGSTYMCEQSVEDKIQ